MEETKFNTNGAGLSQAPMPEDMLQKMKTAESVWLPKEVFESMYLNPERKVAGDLRKKVWNHRELWRCARDVLDCVVLRNVCCTLLIKRLVDRLGIRH